jgi:hypothetical protein
LFVLACGGMGTTNPMAGMAERFAGFDCSAGSSDPDRSWCPAAAAGHGPFTPPETTAIRLGLTLAVRPGEDPRDAVLERTSLSVLFIGTGGAKVLDVTPSNDQEAVDLVGVVMSIAATLKGVPDSSVLVKSDLKGWLSTKTDDLHPLTLDADGGTFEGLFRSAIIQRIEGEPWGAAWVVFENGPDGAFISVFPDSELAVLPE